MTARLRLSTALAADPIRVAIVEHHRRYRETLVTLMKGSSMFRVVGVCKDAEEALDQARHITPDHGMVCVCGSLFLVGEIKQAIRVLESTI